MGTRRRTRIGKTKMTACLQLNPNQITERQCPDQSEIMLILALSGRAWASRAVYPERGRGCRMLASAAGRLDAFRQELAWLAKMAGLK